MLSSLVVLYFFTDIVETQCFAVDSVFTPYWRRCSAAVACRGKMLICMMLERKQAAGGGHWTDSGLNGAAD